MGGVTDTRVREFLSSRLRALEERIDTACVRAGRKRSDITLVAVTKTVSASIAAILCELGAVDLGESRPQELWQKAALLPHTVRWHLVGHLQRNKVARTLPLVSLIHSVDSVRLLQALDQEAERSGRSASVLLEVNVSQEPNKLGFKTEELPNHISEMCKLRHVTIRGMMTMAALTANSEQCRPTFRALRKLLERLRSQFQPAHPFDSLSMGMTNDFEIAIEEGATLVRIGTAFFEGLSDFGA